MSIQMTFFLVSNTIGVFKMLKKLLAKEYKMKDFKKVNTIIGWQFIRETIARIIKINQTACIRNQIINKGFIEYNANVISIKARLAIKMTDLADYKKTEFCKYQYLIGKFIHLAYNIKLNIAFAIK